MLARSESEPARIDGDLARDSLALAELGAELGLRDDELEKLRTVDDLARHLARADAPPARRATRDVSEPGAYDLPPPVKSLGRRLLGSLQRAAHDHLRHVRIEGQHHISWNQNAIIAANHSSHLDVGLVRRALEGYADEALSVAARDYFFSTPARRFLFGNFTHMHAFDRRNTTLAALDELFEELRSGRSLIFFPEGTRAPDGRLRAFQPGIGYLALQAGVGVLPLYIAGAHEALPKGAAVPRSRELAVRIGSLLAPEELSRGAAGLPAGERYRAVAERVREAIVALGAA